MDETGNVDRAYRKVTSAEKRERMVETPLPEGKFDIIYADPPWKYEFAQSGSREVEKEYPTMELDDICKTIPPAADSAILFLWVTVPKVPEGLEVVKAWGFEYKTNLVWVKDKIGMGYYVRNQHELLFIATRGEFGPPAENLRPPSVINADRGKHSAKPERVYELIESMYPGHEHRLEMFSRSARKGWTMWGLEAGGSK
jgi:N6-adenosine-specific RNA methylase IME4